jgi:hypothetical protein
MVGPRSGPSEVRIRVTASGVNPGDVKKRDDTFGLGMMYPRVIPRQTTDKFRRGPPRKLIRFSVPLPRAGFSHVLAEFDLMRRMRTKTLGNWRQNSNVFRQGSNPVPSTPFRNKPFGARVEGLSH